MAAAVQSSHVSPGGKLKRSLKKKKKMKMVAQAAVSKLEDEVKDSSNGEGNVAGRSFGGSEDRAELPKARAGFLALSLW